jgi:2,3-dihydro-2,3-dihydroxybenzoate dehydrogenase
VAARPFIDGLDMNTKPRAGAAVVTGAGQGIGRAIALRLLANGTPVIAIGRNREKLATLAKEAGVMPESVQIVAQDIRDIDKLDQELAAAETQLGSIRFLVNAAGVLSPARLLETSVDEIRETIDINLTSTLIATQHVANRMIPHGAGSIVTISSNSGTTPRTALGAYPASKAGLTHAMKCLGLELAEFNIRCNIVSPGSTDTEMQRAFQKSASDLDGVLKGDLDRWRLGIPLRRMASTEDVADIVLFLLSDQARHITMENIIIDGGAVAFACVGESGIR